MRTMERGMNMSFQMTTHQTTWPPTRGKESTGWWRNDPVAGGRGATCSHSTYRPPYPHHPSSSLLSLI